MEDYNTITGNFKVAQRNRRDLDEDLRDAYRLFLPSEYYGSGLAGESSSNWESENLDATGANALEFRSAEVTNLLFPAYDRFMEFEKLEGARAQDLQEGEDNFHRCLQDSNFYDEVFLVIRSSLISTGCLAVEKTTDPHMPINFRAISTWNIYPMENSAGKLDKVYIMNELSKHEAQMKFGKHFDIDALADSNDKIRVVEYYHNKTDMSCDYACFQYNDGSARVKEGLLLQYENVRDRRLIPGRYKRSTGRAFGVGVAMRALPIARQINYLTGLSNEDLERSFGGWITFDWDEIPPSFFEEGSGVRMVHKPDNANAPEFHQFQYQFNVNNFKMDELKEALTFMIHGPGLPPIESAVRSATEIDSRTVQRQAMVVPETMTLFNELERPLVETVLNILRSEDMADSPYFIGSPEGIKYKPVNRFANLEGKVRAQQIHETVLRAFQMDPNGQFMDVLDMDALMSEYLKLSGISSRFMLSEEQVQALREQKMKEMQEAAAAQAGQGAGGGAGGVPVVSPGAGVSPAQIGGV